MTITGRGLTIGCLICGLAKAAPQTHIWAALTAAIRDAITLHSQRTAYSG